MEDAAGGGFSIVRYLAFDAIKVELPMPLADKPFLATRWWKSISFRLSAILTIFFALVLTLGLFGIARLNDFNTVSVRLADIWLPNTRLLGDLNNYTSDFRAAEASALLALKPSELDASEQDMAALDQSIAQAQRGYEGVVHDTTEAVYYDQFKRAWNDYRKLVDQVLSLIHAGSREEASAVYATTSRAAYVAASDALGRLTNRNVGNVQEASQIVDDAYEQARWMIQIVMLLAAIMAAMAILYVRRSISAPLLALSAGMHRLAKNDTSVEFVGAERGDEIAAMTNAAGVFRKNAVELMLNQSALEREAFMFEEKLAQEQRLTSLQRNFISMISHEFRTPLTVIDGHAQRLIRMKDAAVLVRVVDRAGRIRAAVQRLNYLIDNLLNNSRLLDSGAELYFHPASTDLKELLREACRLQRDVATNIRIVEEFGGLPETVYVDSKLLFQAVSNLLSNAIKYSPSGGQICVGASSNQSCVSIRVQDQGIGIPKGEIDRVFSRYFRASNAAGIIGTGIGLYLVKMIVELHGGSVLVESEEEKGAIFTIVLPTKMSKSSEISISTEASLRRAMKPSFEP